MRAPDPEARQVAERERQHLQRAERASTRDGTRGEVVCELILARVDRGNRRAGERAGIGRVRDKVDGGKHRRVGSEVSVRERAHRAKECEHERLVAVCARIIHLVGKRSADARGLRKRATVRACLEDVAEKYESAGRVGLGDLARRIGGQPLGVCGPPLRE